MNHLQKKCLIASAGFHGLLIGVTIFGAAFFVPREKTTPSIPIKVYYPEQVVDTPTVSPKPTVKATAPVAPPIQAIVVAPPIPQPIQPPVQQPAPPSIPLPKPTPAPTPVFKDEPPAPEPPKVHPKPKPHDKPVTKKKEEPPPADDPAPEPTDDPPVKKKHVIEIDKTSLRPVTRESSHSSRRNKPVEDDDGAQKAEDARVEANYQAAQARAKAAREAAANAAHEIGQMARNLTGETAGTTKVEISGPVGLDAFTANYSDIVGSVYRAAWRSYKPASISERTEKVQVKVTIARNGRVVSKRILKTSGNTDMDRSIERALDVVKIVEPFPAGSKDEERTFVINFDLNAE